MNIAIITSPFGALPPEGIGAIEKRWYYVAENLVKKNVRVSFYSKRKNSAHDKNLTIYRMNGFRRTGTLFGDLIKDFFYSLVALIKLKSCDILILNTFWTPILCVLFRWKYRKSIYNVARFPKGQFKLYPFVDQFSCVSYAASKALEKEIGKDSRIVTINNPVELNDFKYSEEQQSEDFIIMYHGRVHPEKGLHLLFSAANALYDKYPKIKLKILGTTKIESGGGGEKYVNELKQIATNVPIMWIEATSNPTAIAKELASCHLYCYPSIADKGETFGVSPLEAMAIGRAVIVSDLDCFKDFVINDETGFIFDHHSEKAIDQLQGLIEKLVVDQTLRKTIGKAASEKAKQFSVENIANQYLNDFTMLLSVAKR